MRRGIHTPPHVILGISTRQGGYAPPHCVVGTMWRGMPLHVILFVMRRGITPPHCIIFAVLIWQGGGMPLQVVILSLPFQHGEEGICPSSSYYLCHFDMARRVCPSTSCHSDKEEHNPSSSYYLCHFDTVRRICPSTLCHSQRGGYAPPRHVIRNEEGHTPSSDRHIIFAISVYFLL
jgi:hypothetical protein